MKEDRKETNVPNTISSESLPEIRVGVESESDISKTSFKRWHRHLQTEHMRMHRPSFTLWRCCNKACRPCRWFDSINYDKKLCKYCLKFGTCKTLCTILLVGIFIFIFSYSIFKDQVLPGGIIFFLFLLFITAYLVGYVLILVGLPPMLGHILIGIAFDTIASPLAPSQSEMTEKFAKISEQMLLVVALIRAGLLLDISRIQGHVMFIIRLSFLPFCCEFFVVWVVTHFFLRLPWDWSSLQGSVMGVVSLASVTSVMEKNRSNGYGEDKDLSTVLIASSVLNVVFGVCSYAVCITYVISECGQQQPFWMLMLLILKELALGFSVGALAGFLIAFFPDKRHTEAAALRILVIGIASFAIGNIFYASQMTSAAVLGCLTMCIIAANMWEELGWHKDHNPVQYFYTMVYYFSQPVVLSLLGYTLHFNESETEEVGFSVCVVLIGLIGREFACYGVTSSGAYETTFKERIFICIAWLSKGTFQGLLANTVGFIVESHKKHLDGATLDEFLKYSRTLRETTVIAILLTTPLVCLSLTLLTPVLLTKSEPPIDMTSHATKPFTRRRGNSVKDIGRFSISHD